MRTFLYVLKLCCSLNATRILCHWKKTQIYFLKFLLHDCWEEGRREPSRGPHSWVRGESTLEKKLLAWHHMVHGNSLIRCLPHLTLHSLSSSEVFVLLCAHVHSQYLVSSSPLPLLSLTVWSWVAADLYTHSACLPQPPRFKCLIIEMQCPFFTSKVDINIFIENWSNSLTVWILRCCEWQRRPCQVPSHQMLYYMQEGKGPG